MKDGEKIVVAKLDASDLKKIEEMKKIYDNGGGYFKNPNKKKVLVDDPLSWAVFVVEKLSMWNIPSPPIQWLIDFLEDECCE